MIGKKAKIKSATVIHVIRIDFNQSNKVFTYQKWYLKSVHTFHQPLQAVGAAGGQNSKKAKKKSATEGRLIPLI